MLIRERTEQLEHTLLSPYAAFADQSQGRATEEPQCDTRTCFQRDIDRITYSKAFRRLMHKTQVFLQPEGDHFRTRMTHTLEVSRIARTIAFGLRLNENLVEAMALGHDLGHTPFGHAGEVALSQATGKPFRHNEQSLRVVDLLERNGLGLNLCNETRMGILCHSWKAQEPTSLEGWVLRYADRIAYINHDVDDAMRAGFLTEAELPSAITDVLGTSHSRRINTLVQELIASSVDRPCLQMNPEIYDAMEALRKFMFERVYHHPAVQAEDRKAQEILERLFTYFMKHPEEIPQDFRPQMDFDGLERVVCDYIACMTDKYAIYRYQELFIPISLHTRKV